MTFQKGNKLRKGLRPANAFKKGEIPKKSVLFGKGQKQADNTGRTPWNKNKKYHLKNINPNSHRVGENAQNWQGGLTPENERARRNQTYDLWRLSVYEKDNFKCTNCNKTGVQLHAHHLKSFAKNKELRYDINNGVTLCRECHIKIHTKTGGK